jgi:hypothetical protein
MDVDTVLAGLRGDNTRILTLCKRKKTTVSSGKNV